MAFISVAEWQDMLNEIGTDPPLLIDDDFGPLTRQAIIDAFQRGDVTAEWVNGRIERAKHVYRRVLVGEHGSLLGWQCELSRGGLVAEVV